MKKIFFNNEFGLTQAVIDGHKTMTRRIMNPQPTWVSGDGHVFNDSKKSMYHVGEIVAVAQAYKDIISDRVFFVSSETGVSVHRSVKEREKGWTNKMNVAAEFMPHQIRITNIRVERLQDISDDDCLKEGIEFSLNGRYYVNYDIVTHNRRWLERDIKSSFARLIDSISGKGTWESNPYVFVYSFELVK